MTFKKAQQKLLLERIAMAPFVWLGKCVGYLFPLKRDHPYFLFFPNADIGGSPKVNADITELLQQQHPLIVFSKKALNNQYLERYQQTGVRIIDLHRYIDNKFFHFVNFFFRGLLAAWINQQKNPVVFGGESIFFYKVIPHLRKDIRCVELTHVDVWLNYTIGFVDRIDARIFSTRKGMQKVMEQYQRNHLPPSYQKKLHFIDNAVNIPQTSITQNELLEIFFIGRGATQKRVYLVADIATALHQKKLPVHFNFVGDVEKIIDPTTLPFCSFYGIVKEEDKMQAIYEKADVLILTSAFEGLPVVIMQMMAYGKVVLSTAVSGIPDYIFHQENGLLIHSTAETAIVEDAIQLIKLLIQQPALRLKLGAAARQDAIRQFSRNSFNAEYLSVLNGNR
jgi:glycosyltransferase involved in cell wall biosynthesis